MPVIGNNPGGNFTATVDPTINDDVDSGYPVGSIWVNTVTGIAYMSSDSTAGAAVWVPLRDDVISAYDNLGGQTFTGTITVNLDSVKKNTNSSIYSLAADVVTVNQDGTFMFMYDCGLDLNSGTTTESSSFLEEDSGSGFVEVDGSRAYAHHRSSNQATITSSVGIAFDVTAGDQFRLRAQRVDGSGTLITLADSSRLSIMRIL
jgi:hypothetical protein